MSKRFKSLVLPVESKGRDIEARILLAGKAAKRGYAIFLGSRSAVKKNINYLPSGVVFYKDTWSTSLRLLNSFKKCGFKITGIDEEGLVMLSEAIYISQRVDPQVVELFDMLYAWGNVQKHVISKWYPEYADKIKVIGNVRFDFLKPAYSFYTDAKSHELKGRFGKFIMFNTKLGAYNHTLGPEGYIEMFRSQGMLKTREDEEFRYAFQNYIKRLFYHYVDIIPRIAEKFKDYEVIVRPHPSENINVWQEKFKEHSRITVTRDGNISYWLKAAELVIHTGCTTGIEAVISGTPAITYRPFTFEREDVYLPNAVSIEAKGEEDLINLASSLLKKELEFLTPEKTKILDQYVENWKANDVADCILDDYESFALTDKVDSFVKLKLRGLSVKNLIMGSLKSQIFKRKDSKYRSQKFSGLSADEVCQTLSQLFPESRFKISKIDKDLLMICLA